MDGWIYRDPGIYVKPIDWEECYVIEPDTDGVSFELARCNVDKTVPDQVIGTGATPVAAARLIKEKARE